MANGVGYCGLQRPLERERAWGPTELPASPGRGGQWLPGYGASFPTGNPDGALGEGVSRRRLSVGRSAGGLGGEASPWCPWRRENEHPACKSVNSEKVTLHACKQNKARGTLGEGERGSFSPTPTGLSQWLFSNEPLEGSRRNPNPRYFCFLFC